MTEPILQIQHLEAEVDGKRILHDVNVVVPRGEVHAVMGPNGSGKSTLANVLMGHPSYTCTGGTIRFMGQDVTALGPDERARLGMFLALQYPVEVPGVSMLNFLRTALGAVRGEQVPVRDFHRVMKRELEDLGLDMSFARRNVNEGFSGGEKKRHEVLQMRLLKPALAILDETDSGLDIDGIRQVANAVQALKEQGTSVLIITHYMRILNYLEPDRVHVLVGGQVVQTGGRELAATLEQGGYGAFRAEPRNGAESAPA